jgi:hypothetical protein
VIEIKLRRTELPNLIVTDILPPYALYKMSTDKAGALFLDQVEAREARRMLGDRQFDTVEYHFQNPNVGKFASRVLGTRFTMQSGTGYPVNTQDIFLLITPLNNALNNNVDDLLAMFKANEVVFQVIKVDLEIPQIDSVNLDYANDARVAVEQYEITTVETEDVVEESSDYYANRVDPWS